MFSHAPGFNPQHLVDRLGELEEEAAAQRSALAQPYAEVILRHSSYRKPQRDRCVDRVVCRRVLAGVTLAAAGAATAGDQRLPQAAARQMRVGRQRAKTQCPLM